MRPADDVIDARLVIGADGRDSFVARSVGDREYATYAAPRFAAWSYYRGALPDAGRLRIGRFGTTALIATPADDGLILVGVVPAMSERDEFLADRDVGFATRLARWPELADLVAGARREGPMRIVPTWHAYFRASAGSGWALVGDAGHFKDPRYPRWPGNRRERWRPGRGGPGERPEAGSCTASSTDSRACGAKVLTWPAAAGDASFVVHRRLRFLLLSVSALAVVVAGFAPAASARGVLAHRDVAIAVSGDVGAPRIYTAQELAALPRTSVDDAHGHAVTGASLEDVVTDAAPALPAGKNTQLRVAITVTGAGGRAVTVALGELDPGFGNHPALLVGDRRDIDLVVPGDRTSLRRVPDVRSIRVHVSTATAVAAPTGGLIIDGGGRRAVLSATQLARLPQATRHVTFQAGAATQTHTEAGPGLFTVLLAAHLLPTPVTSVTAVGDDSYAATVTPAEDYLDGRPLLVSLAEDGVPLAQPRLVADGDVKGGRDVSGLVELSVDGGLVLHFGFGTA